jgi:hypothetical protein
MGDLLKLIWYAAAGLFRSRAALQTEVLALRHQLNVLRRRAPKRVAVSNIDRLAFAGLHHLAPEVLDPVNILKPETIIRWHRAGFRAWWRWKSRPRGGRPRTPDEIRQLIREMSVANPLWGAPRIHGELLKLSMDVGQSTVAKYMAKRRRPPSQGWRTFVHNHADAIASIDMFVVPTISFGLLYGLLILRQSRRELLWLAPVRRDVCRTGRVRSSPISGRATPSICSSLSFRQGQGRASTLLDPRPRVWRCLHPAHPGHGHSRPTGLGAVTWQNGYAERLIGSIRRECLDHVVVVGKRHLRHVLASYQTYYNEVRTHLSLHKDAPVRRDVCRTGRMRSSPILGGLHHQYVRV